MQKTSIQDLEKRLEKIEQEEEKSKIEDEFAKVLREYKGDDEVISFKDVGELEKITAYSSGLQPLDEMLRGFHEGDLVVTTAATGQGKTSLLQTFTVNMHRKGIKSLWFTYEVPIQQLMTKFSELPDGYVPKMLRERSLIWIERKVVEAIVKFGVKAVYIDPFNSLTRFTQLNLSQELGDIAEGLKDIALKYKVIVFTSAHTRKLQENETMGVDSIRDTALLGNKADTVLAIWRIPERQTKLDRKTNGVIYTRDTMISVVKNRFAGALGSFKVSYVKNSFVLPDISHYAEEEQANVPMNFFNEDQN
ncbi:MAG: DNA directed DNA polymerase [Siphoviridae sp. cttb18]|nr:MAG: DNA directed DNA polymerase [Siphoviridae sp. cttb18]